MKPAPFRYVAPATLEEALSLLAEHGTDATVLAGGQSLVPLLNLRLARPAVVIDVGRIEELRGIDNGDGLRIGATTTQAAVLATSAIEKGAPLVGRALREVGTPATRSRGTVGGSLAHGDPAAELPAVMLAVEAELQATSTRGSRAIAASEFFAGPFTTSLAPDEVLTEIRVPGDAATRGYGFAELSRRHGDFALAGACCTGSTASRAFWDLRIVLFGAAPTPIRAHDSESMLAGRDADDTDAIAAAAAAAAEACDPASDVHASASYRRRAVAVVAQRALSQLGGQHD